MTCEYKMSEPSVVVRILCDMFWPNIPTVPVEKKCEVVRGEAVSESEKHAVQVEEGLCEVRSCI